jgi:hypothetical protein
MIKFHGLFYGGIGEKGFSHKMERMDGTGGNWG